MGPRLQLQQILSDLPGVTEAFFQAPTKTLQVPYIQYELASPNDPAFADNVKYRLKKGYTVIVVDRNPDSLIPDLVEELPYSRLDRRYKTNGLYHTAFHVYF